MASCISYVAVALVLAVNSVCGLECFTCDSKVNAACKTSFGFISEQCEPDVLEYGTDIAKCYRLEAKNKEGDQHIARGCLKKSIVGCHALAIDVGWITDAWRSDPGSVDDVKCKTCEMNMCNTASRTTGFTVLGLLLAGASFLL